MDNMKFYNMGRTVPDEAKKPISAGRLKGMTDINPMWRIKRLTEMFGACGIGWLNGSAAKGGSCIIGSLLIGVAATRVTR